MAKDFASINLLRNNRKETIEHIINWTVTIGRILVVVVELAALAAFLYRFTLDNQLQDLQTKIKQEQTIVAVQAKTEASYRNLQDRLTVASSFSGLGTQNVKTFKDIIAFAPQGMTFTTVNFSTNGIQFQANVDSVLPLSVFIGKLKAYPLIDTVSIDQIQNKTSTAMITVGISTTFKKQGGLNAVSGN